MFIEMTIKEFLNRLASDSPAPGGGSVSALAGSLGAALSAMVARFTAGRKGSEELEQQIEHNLQVSLRLQRLLQEDVSRDTAAYNAVVAAYRMPKESEADQAVRSRTIQEALQEATRLPLQVAQRSLEVFKLSLWALEKGNPNTWSDAMVAVSMAQSGIEGALSNVAINLDGIKDTAFIEEMRAQAGEIRREAQRLREKIGDPIQDRLS
ncbi:MAG TPA: cyclodeaminase/cyclohydrolase family protein [Firmicutes bacterium]|nr:cyclodeaminase/cyclohydrolase family protein [Bacillota bacterium]